MIAVTAAYFQVDKKKWTAGQWVDDMDFFPVFTGVNRQTFHEAFTFHIY